MILVLTNQHYGRCEIVQITKMTIYGKSDLVTEIEEPVSSPPTVTWKILT